MRNTITFRRWRIDLYGNALHLQREPKPNCKDCNGIGRTDPESQGIDAPSGAPVPAIEICDCWNPWGGVRIPLGRRAVVTERCPF